MLESVCISADKVHRIASKGCKAVGWKFEVCQIDSVCTGKYNGVLSIMLTRRQNKVCQIGIMCRYHATATVMTRQNITLDTLQALNGKALLLRASRATQG